VRAARGCHDAAVALGVPFISGKDSLFNEYRLADGSAHAIPGTLLISALGIVPDIRRMASMHLKRPGNVLYLVGVTGNDLGGSLALRLHDSRGIEPPHADLTLAKRVFSAIHRAIRAELVQACHDLSEGGLAVAAAEMAIGGRHGVEIALQGIPVGGAALADATLLFAESPTRFLIEITPQDAAAFEKVVSRVPHAMIGQVLDDDRFVISNAGRVVITTSVDRLRNCWRAPLAETQG
jgi:phosphoribosylformylglycinamidine synthase